MKRMLFLGFGFLSLTTHAQLVVQSGATLFIDAGATITVQGDLTSNADISGTGKIIMKGSALQNLNMNGFTIPNLEIDNASNVALGSIAKVSNVLNFVNGKLQLGANNFILTSTGSFTNAGAGKFAETNGAGEFRKEVSAVGNYTLPVGAGSDYNPVTFQLAGNTLSSAYVGGRAINSGHPAKHPRSTDFLSHYWSLSRSGVSGGTVTTIGTYNDGADVTGVEADMRAMTYSGSAWALGTSIDAGANSVTASMSGTNGDLYAMNRFVLVTPKVFLQGAYNSGTGLMNDNLRSTDVTQTPGNPSTNNVIPTSDPYRTSPLSSSFVHTSNNSVETINSSVLYHAANPENNVVDWVFLELRNTATSGNTVLQTRSALIQRDGDIVDIDGVSPVYFKNVDAGSYTIGIRHRNHLGMYTNPSNFNPSLSLVASSLNFTGLNSNSLMGAANSNYFNDGNLNMLFAGNASMNSRITYSGSGNDPSYILSTLLIGDPNGFIANTYSIGDVTMNRRVTYSGSGNDASYILATILSGDPNGFKTESRPN